MARSKLHLEFIRLMRIAHSCDQANLSTEQGLMRAQQAAQKADHGRRRFLAGAGAALGAAALGSLPVGRRLFAKQTSLGRVAIVGAGLAGLICADRLQRKGVLATVYEANRTRVGGRCKSARDTFPGQVAELGGEMIDNAHKTMLGYAKEFKLELEDYGKQTGTKSYFFGGRHHNEAEVINEYRQLVPRMRPDLQALSNAPSFFSHTPADVALDNISLEEYLATRCVGLPLIQQVLSQAYISEYGLEPSEQSCLNLLLMIHLDRRSKFAEFGASDERYHIVAGNDVIPTRIRDRLMGPILMGKSLKSLSRASSGPYHLGFGDGSTAEADAVVLAIPFSVLRTVTLDASLGFSADKLRAINDLGYGNNAKTMIGFDGRPWFDQHGRSGAAYSDLPELQNTWETNYARTTTTSILTDYSGGDRGHALQMIPAESGGCQACHGTGATFLPADLGDTIPQEQIDAFLTDLERVFPGAKSAARRDVEGRYIARRGHWLPQSLSRGSYTCYKPGQFTGIAGLEGQSADLLKFAGEHANSFYEAQGYMEGAALSGIAAAEEILADIAAGRL